MSYVFDDESGSEVWVPALHVGRLFVDIAECIADGLGVSTGLEKLADDWYKIHSETFAKFVHNIIKRTWHHSVHRELERGFVAVSIVLLGAIGMTAEAETYAGLIDLESPLSLETLRGAMPPHLQ